MLRLKFALSPVSGSALLGLLFLVGCATQPYKVEAQKVPIGKFFAYNCSDLSTESFLISDRSVELYHKLKVTADADKVQFLTGIVLVVPLFFLDGGDGEEVAELSRLQGEYNAITALYKHRRCRDEGHALAPPLEDVVGKYQPRQ